MTSTKVYFTTHVVDKKKLKPTMLFVKTKITITQKYNMKILVRGK